MPTSFVKEKSAGAAVFRIEQDKLMYLLLHYPSSAKTKKSYWDLPKGHIEGKETEQETAQREVEEETGIADVVFFPGFQVRIHYFFQSKGKKISKTVVFFLAETKEKRVRISHEHLAFQWLPYKEALKELKYENAKRVIRAAQEFLQMKGQLKNGQ